MKFIAAEKIKVGDTLYINHAAPGQESVLYLYPDKKTARQASQDRVHPDIKAVKKQFDDLRDYEEAERMLALVQKQFVLAMIKKHIIKPLFNPNQFHQIWNKIQMEFGGYSRIN